MKVSQEQRANNCCDEAVINANFGLGESVASGAVEPDAFVGHRVMRSLISEKIGTKDHCLAAAAKGGLEKR